MSEPATRAALQAILDAEAAEVQPCPNWQMWVHFGYPVRDPGVVPNMSGRRTMAGYWARGYWLPGIDTSYEPVARTDYRLAIRDITGVAGNSLRAAALTRAGQIEEFHEVNA